MTTPLGFELPTDETKISAFAAKLRSFATTADRIITQLKAAAAVVSGAGGRTVTVWDTANNREQLIYGDTGILQLKNAGIKQGTATLRRVGNTVFFRTQATAFNAVTTSNLIPSGFRPTGVMVPLDSSPYWSSEMSIRSRINNADLQLVVASSVGAITNLSAVWDTSEPWPTTLPS